MIAGGEKKQKQLNDRETTFHHIISFLDFMPACVTRVHRRIARIIRAEMAPPPTMTVYCSLLPNAPYESRHFYIKSAMVVQYISKWPTNLLICIVLSCTFKETNGILGCFTKLFKLCKYVKRAVFWFTLFCTYAIASTDEAYRMHLNPSKLLKDQANLELNVSATSFSTLLLYM